MPSGRRANANPATAIRTSVVVGHFEPAGLRNGTGIPLFEIICCRIKFRGILGVYHPLGLC